MVSVDHAERHDGGHGHCSQPLQSFARSRFPITSTQPVGIRISGPGRLRASCSCLMPGSVFKKKKENILFSTVYVYVSCLPVRLFLFCFFCLFCFTIFLFVILNSYHLHAFLYLLPSREAFSTPPPPPTLFQSFLLLFSTVIIFTLFISVVYPSCFLFALFFFFVSIFLLLQLFDLLFFAVLESHHFSVALSFLFACRFELEMLSFSLFSFCLLSSVLFFAILESHNFLSHCLSCLPVVLN